MSEPIQPKLDTSKHGTINIRSAFKDDFLQSILNLVSARLGAILITLISSILIARYLGPEKKGLLAVATVLASMAIQFGDFGMSAANVYFGSKEKKDLPSIVLISLTSCIGIGLLLISASGIVYFLFPNLRPLEGILYFLPFLYVPFGLLYLHFQNLLLATQQLRNFNRVEILSGSANLAGLLMLMLIGVFDEVNVYSLRIGCFTAIALWMIYTVSRTIKFKSRGISFPISEYFGYGFRNYLASIFAFLVMKFDQLMLQAYQGAEEVGLYSIAVNLGEYVYLLPTVIGTLLLPKLSAMPALSDKWAYTLAVIKRSAPILLLVTAAAAIGAYHLVYYLFGQAFIGAVPSVYWLLPGVFILSVNTIIMRFFGSIGTPTVAIYSTAIAFALNFLLNTLWIPRWGGPGAAAASTVAYSAMLVVSMIYLWTRRREISL